MKNIDTVVDFASKTIDNTMNATNNTIDKVSKVTKEVADTIGEKGDQIRSVEQRLVKETTSYIRDNPLRSVGIAVGVGFLLSKWFNDR
ncbi:DUF883 family protein [Nitrosomonas ureae]|uniref:ElaB/YqjD/DUF883 family membrane-anchored ribosome-binding protein n=1 Tax=Nitrosomonas ureae TaxID=44577 RepID=A0A0S3AK84_9PROT|nr:DUF883 family protein [Nitrosomonas ureae]ALQ51569.1 hypothetical protein ATY38_10300 [Nitrosomonas ureae]PTQ77823.1 ElaB/YqjD/DUF883 family membrane-anchored ribosome-binding protein [Nitrosomonas ureae]PXX07122.1 ElaB/YqjD/DUF883 family membrane-anchored ribosome-binding protein [Nitrosomonas ureae]SDU35364.1 Membrane-anchored ribosome-binding protein, inhibits growth in stationary phase, ElaB/YqjD/DUF883 family [Nitrosomonas ureae]